MGLNLLDIDLSTNRLFEVTRPSRFPRVPKYVVAPVDSLPPGSQRRVVLDGRGVAIFNVEGVLSALRDVCPHQGAELSAGTVVRSVTADQPGAYELDMGRVMVKCPWHGWEFDLATGQSWCDPVRQRTRAYPVSVEAGAALAGNEAGPQPGPYVAETIAITVEDDYIVVEIDSPSKKAVEG
jgi:nitrite reductase/ring-hydroxylating ferredoxin subunit